MKWYYLIIIGMIVILSGCETIKEDVSFELDGDNVEFKFKDLECTAKWVLKDNERGLLTEEDVSITDVIKFNKGVLKDLECNQEIVCTEDKCETDKYYIELDPEVGEKPEDVRKEIEKAEVIEYWIGNPKTRHWVKTTDIIYDEYGIAKKRKDITSNLLNSNITYNENHTRFCIDINIKSEDKQNIEDCDSNYSTKKEKAECIKQFTKNKGINISNYNWNQINFRKIPFKIKEKIEQIDALEGYLECFDMPEIGEIMALGWKTETWSTSEDCDIYDDRVKEDVTIIASCSVIVWGAATLTFSNVLFQDNSTASNQHDHGPEDGGTWIMDNTRIEDYGATGNNFDYRGWVGGTSIIKSTSFDDDAYPYFYSISNITDTTFGSTVYFTGSSTNILTNATFGSSARAYFTQTSVNTITNSTFGYYIYFYNTILATITNSTLKGTQTRVYDTANLTFNKPYSTITRLYPYSTNENPIISGYLIPNIYKWDTGNNLHRFFPIYVYTEGTEDPVESANVSIDDINSETVNSGITDADGFVDLEIIFNATNYGAGNFNIYLDRVDKGDINASTSTAPDGLILYGPAADTCTYTSGDWNVECSDNCTISSLVSGDGGVLNIGGDAGVFNIDADITGFSNYHISGDCVVSCQGGCIKQ